MRSVDNDMLLQSILQSELKRIPRWLQITKVKLVFALIVEIIIALMVVYSLNPEAIAAHTFIANTFLAHFRYWYFVLPFAAIIPLWFCKAYRQKAMAYQTATQIASSYIAKRNREITRDYGGYCDVPARNIKSTKLNNEPKYCPTCGLILVPGEFKCRSCVADGHKNLIIPTRS